MDRNPDGTFKEGHKGFKKKGTRHMTTLLKEYIQKEIEGVGTEYDKQITETVLTKALEGESWAVKLVYEYLDGKPHQTTDVTSDGESINIQIAGAIAEKNNLD